MKQIAVCLLVVAVGIDGAKYCAAKTRVPLTWFLDINADTPDLIPDFIPDWHFKEPRLSKLCFGFCPEMEN
jgi:hypothetical protein